MYITKNYSPVLNFLKKVKDFCIVFEAYPIKAVTNFVKFFPSVCF